MKANEKTCCFTGHRKIAKSDIKQVSLDTREAVVSLIERGVKYFGAGGALGFDTIAAQVVLDLKQEYPNIKLILVLPCLEQTMKWQEDDVRMYEFIKSQADKITYTSQHYDNDCMLKRNRHLVDHSGYCICYYRDNNPRSGTGYTIRYAEKQGLEIINIA